MKLDVKAFGLACGLVWAQFLFLASILSLSSGYAYDFMQAIVSLYPGFTTTIKGIAVGMMWSVVFGFAGGAFIAIVYNKVVKQDKS